MSAISLTLSGMDYGGGPVLGPLSLSVDHGETVAILGPSGIGKTTLMRIVAGLELRFTGRRIVQGRMAMIFQEPTLLPWRNAADNISIATGADAAQVNHALDEVELHGLGERFPRQLSTGQQRRLSMARAFAAKPDVLLMDEPFVSLDDETAGEMLSLFERLRSARAMAVMLITHSEAEADRLATRRLRLSGKPAALSEQ